MSKSLLILCAQSDPCNEELALIEAVDKLFRLDICKAKVEKEDDLKGCLCGKNSQQWDYVYLATHADIEGFGDADGKLDLKWTKFAMSVCESQGLASGAMLFLACCRGGLKSVAERLFENCDQIDYVCGPRWTLRPDDIAAAFHVFIYNLEVRREQPTVAVTRACQAIGYDFFCYDRAEWEDQYYIPDDNEEVQIDPAPEDEKELTGPSCKLPSSDGLSS